mmetsp:Transcript_26873/g.47813  ORF Transcript_26873/g.47813 Transcript_26873/m.47813 type:complete len:235 (+) Transcript_26873:643-1347(+)
MFEPTTLSFTCLLSASLSVIHSNIFVFPEESAAWNPLLLVIPTCRRRAGSVVLTMHSTSSLRYTVRTPGNEGESISSSWRTTFEKSKVTISGLMLSISDKMRSAVCLAFSCGSRFVPGSRRVGRVRPSGNFSSISMRSLGASLVAAPAGRSFSTTTSTTRTSFLCSVASNMSLEAPVCTSRASCSIGLALPTPNKLGSMLCSIIVFLKSSTSVCSSWGAAGAVLSSSAILLEFT